MLRQFGVRIGTANTDGINFTVTWCYIQEAGSKSYQGDQGICTQGYGMQFYKSRMLEEMDV